MGPRTAPLVASAHAFIPSRQLTHVIERSHRHATPSLKLQQSLHRDTIITTSAPFHHQLPISPSPLQRISTMRSESGRPLTFLPPSLTSPFVSQRITPPHALPFALYESFLGPPGWEPPQSSAQPSQFTGPVLYPYEPTLMQDRHHQPASQYAV